MATLPQVGRLSYSPFFYRLCLSNEICDSKNLRECSKVMHRGNSLFFNPKRINLSFPIAHVYVGIEQKEIGSSCQMRLIQKEINGMKTVALQLNKGTIVEEKVRDNCLFSPGTRLNCISCTYIHDGLQPFLALCP